jgi:hypothetical protein
VHVFVARGSGSFSGSGPGGSGAPTALAEGDALRLTLGGAGTVDAGPDGAEVLIWETYSNVG